ncbi:MAG: YfhO family protein, partial [Oscillospiraceae bacterium]|nr:YfhO family protein [Oscillospiraceae bacterium]
MIKKRSALCPALSYLLCFAVPLLLMLTVFARLGIHPFGSKSLLIVDMNSQYADFYQGLRHILSGKASPLFSWQMALGNNFWGLFTYYVSSPLSLIPLLFPESALPDGILVMVLIKIGLCGLTFAIFARRVFNIPAALMPGLAAAYAMMSYNVIYSMMPMWLDTVALLPLMALGVEQLLKNGRRLPIIGWTALCIVCNYYTAYMAILFLSLWFVYRLALKTNIPGALRFAARKCGQFALCIATSCGLCAAVLLPAYFSLKGGRIAGEARAFPRLSLASLGVKLLNGAYDRFYDDAAPLIYCGAAVALLCVCFFFRKRIPLRERLAAGGLVIIISLCYCAPSLNGLFHLFHLPNWFPYRYAFIGSFTIIALACRAAGEIRPEMAEARPGGKKRSAKLSGAPQTVNGHTRTLLSEILPGIALTCILYILIGSAIGFVLPETGLTVTDGGFAVQDAWDSSNLLPRSFLLLCAFSLLLILRQAVRGAARKRFITGLFALLLCGDMFLNADTLIAALDRGTYYHQYTDWTDAVALTRPALNALSRLDTGFYRVEKDYQRTFNDPIALGYNGISHYSSAYKQNTNSLLKSLGMWQNWFWSSGRGSTLVTDAMFGVKYRLSRAGEMPGYDLLFSQDGVSVFENSYVLPIAFMSRPYPLEGNPFERQNALARGIYPDGGDVFSPAFYSWTELGFELGDSGYVRAEGQSALLVCTVEAVTDGLLYLYMDTAENYADAAVYVNGRYIGSTAEESGVNYTFCLG